MKNYEFKNNNSKKLIIGVSILFCTVILIIGGTIAYFTQSDIADTGNIVTTDINGTIGYGDDNDYMRNNLIPVKEDEVSLFAMKNTSNTDGTYTNDDICLYQGDMYACSLYQFTITNNSNVAQDMMVTLNPYPNEFANLHYMMYVGEQDKLTTKNDVAKEATHIDGENPSTMINSVILTPEQSITYTVVFYIKNLTDIDQTSVDAGKHFGAIIRVDSITTGTYVVNTIGETCYEMEEITEEGELKGTYKLTKFNGIDENGNVNTSCGVTKDDKTGFYSVTIPSVIAGNKISTLGNRLFMAVNLDEDLYIESSNIYHKIEKITIEDGITTIEDGYYDPDPMNGGIKYSTFNYVGYNWDTEEYITTLSLQLPNSLKNIGIGSFYNSSITNLNIPESVTYIGRSAFEYNWNMTNLVFLGDLYSVNNKLSIGEYAFNYCNLGAVYTTQDNPLILPARINEIGKYAFTSDSDMVSKYILYFGDNQDIINNSTTWYTIDTTLLTND